MCPFCGWGLLGFTGFGFLVVLVLACAGWALDSRWPVPSRLLTCKPFHRKKPYVVASVAQGRGKGQQRGLSVGALLQLAQGRGAFVGGLLQQVLTDVTSYSAIVLALS